MNPTASIIAAAFLIALCGQALAENAAGTAQASTQRDVQRGHQIFMQDGCYECHGTVGQGGAAGPRIAPEPMPVEAIIAYLRRPAGQMPPFSPKVLSDDEIRDIHAYLSSVPGGKPNDLNQVIGH
jgi:mono/diheme cytochrome c family protein